MTQKEAYKQLEWGGGGVEGETENDRLVNSARPKNLSRVQSPHITTSINKLGLRLMVRHTVNVITSWYINPTSQHL
jgi:hypothetical protein